MGMGDSVVFEGAAWKRASIVQLQWRSRYFVLWRQGPRLQYFRRADGEWKPKGAIAVGDIQACKSRPRSLTRRCVADARRFGLLLCAVCTAVVALSCDRPRAADCCCCRVRNIVPPTPALCVSARRDCALATALLQATNRHW